MRGLRGAVVALGLSACAAVSAGEAQVAAKFAGDRTLVVEFAQAMHTWDNAVRDDAVRITPALPAKCGWDSDTRLACALGQATAMATRYRIDIAAGLQTQGGERLKAQYLEVETARPQLVARIERWSAGLPSILVWANMPVEAEEARKVLRLQVDGKTVPLKALRPLPPAWKGDQSTRFAMALPDIGREERVLSLDIVPGLHAKPGPLRGTQTARLLTARAHEPFALHGVACAGRRERVFARVRDNTVEAHCVPGEPILLVFTRSLENEATDRIAASLPSGIDVSQGWEGESYRNEIAVVAPARPIRMASPKPNARVDFVLDGAIRSVDGEVLAPTTVRIVTGDAQPQLHAANGHSLVADGRHPPILVELLNADAANMEVTGLAQRAAQETVQIQGKPGTAVPVASTVAARTLAEGGWVRWSTDAQLPERWQGRGQVEFAAPAFDLLAVAGRREVLAWANEWERDAPVVGAEVELLWRSNDTDEPRVAARGRTGADGTVLLRLPDDLVIAPPEGEDAWSWSGPSWLLRAADARGSRRSVLPVGNSGDSPKLGQARQQKTWGVSDRPLYHAGDAVHYRLWQRELDGLHLRPLANAAVKLRLFDTEREKTVLEWQATPAVDGSLTGDLSLPIHLTDATYCIGVEAGYGETDGSCFFVGTYRAQDLWVEAKSRGGVLRDGDRYVADLKAGYFSGGVAAGVEIDDLGVTLVPFPLQEAYPQYADFTFVEVEEEDTESAELTGLPEDAKLDGEGAFHIDTRVAFDEEHRPPFGVLALEAQVSPDDREGTVGNDEATRYARFDRYVGLKTSPAWFDRDELVSLEAVVITANGEPVAGDVDVVIDYVSSYGGKEKGERVAHCKLRTGVPAPCEFPRRHSGYYRLTASSEGAASTRLTRYVWAGDAGIDNKVDEPELTIVDASPQRTTPIRVLVRHNFKRARALFVIASGGTILSSRVETLVGGAQNVTLPVAREWNGRLSLQAYVRDAVAAGTRDGYRKPVSVEVLSEHIDEATVEATPAPVSLSFEPVTARPGSRATLLLRNDSRHARSVTVAVIDDALRSQAQRWLPYGDPQGPSSFAQWRAQGVGSLQEHSFADWDGQPWQWLLPDAPPVATPSRSLLPPPPQPAVVVEDAVAVHAMDMPAAAPGVMRDRRDGYAESTTLDSIEVTGSRIKRADIVEARTAKAPDPSAHAREQGQTTASPQQAVRTRFADTALWLSALTLAPGESRRVDVELPDNLTRWRAVVWSTGDADDFAMAEAALEVGLPVEARLQTPVRVYPGDETRVATHVRHIADQAATAQTALHVEGPDGAHDDAHDLPLQPRGQGSVATVLHPQATGTLRLIASAGTSAGRDAVAADIEVASPLIAAHRLQAGWIGDAPITLALPVLPPEAEHPQLRVALLRGNAALTAQWTDDLHRYPHRCWEQILSRAVGAALALERHDASWPDAAAAVREALDNAAVFQTNDGGFVYFPGAGNQWYSRQASVPLTAYSVRALNLLGALGHRVQPHVMEKAREFLALAVKSNVAARNPTSADRLTLAQAAFAAAGYPAPSRVELDRLWQAWKLLPLPAQIAAARALADAEHPSAAAAIERLLEQAPLRGNARALRLGQRYDGWMSSDQREQCALISLVRDHPQLTPLRVPRELLAGLSDLYAGGVPAVDTQTAAYCLIALRESQQVANAPTQATFAVAHEQRTLLLASDEAKSEWTLDAPTGSQLRIEADAGSQVPTSYVAELAYVEDARQAQASAVGFRLERSYFVLRNGAWLPAGTQRLHEGDWIRVTLTIETTAQREFVALTDSVPGGLRPTDLELSGVAGDELKRVGDEGARWFETRKLDARNPRFYAESLPAGRHDVHYFARVGNSGDYLAAPAEAELMYGAATRARTAATRLRFEADR
ncbi:alpha-2-macroglobulin family protein [Lysobacter terrae]